jgi:hypothetical protein
MSGVPILIFDIYNRKPCFPVERSEQLQRYRESLGNLILTDYLEFRWYVGGAPRLTTRLARVGVKGKLQAEKDGEKQVVALLTAFLDSKYRMGREAEEGNK